MGVTGAQALSKRKRKRNVRFILTAPILAGENDNRETAEEQQQPTNGKRGLRLGQKGIAEMHRFGSTVKRVGVKLQHESKLGWEQARKVGETVGEAHQQVFQHAAE